MIDAMAILFAAAKHHRGGGAQSQRVRGAMHLLPFIGGTLQTRDAMPDFVVKDFRAASRNGAQARIAQPRDSIPYGKARDFGDAEHFRRRKTMQVNLREALLDRAQQIFVVVDAQIGMQSALHENAGATEGYGLFDFLQDRVQ